jgi:peptide/nickel transport system substrate-binding protein
LSTYDRSEFLKRTALTGGAIAGGGTVLGQLFDAATAIAAAAPTGKITVALDSLANANIDPVVSSASNTLWEAPVYDWLVGVNAKGLPAKTGIASNWKITPASGTNGANGGHVYTFTIRKGIKFQDGTPMTSADVAFSLGLESGPTSKSSYATFLKGLIDSVTTPDDHTVVVTTNQGAAMFLNALSRAGDTTGMILPKAYYTSVGSNGFSAQPIGTGAWKVTSNVVNSAINFTAWTNKHWLHGAPRFKDFSYQVSTDEATRVSQLLAGEVDVINISANASKSTPLSAHNCTIRSIPQGSNVGLYFHESWHGYFADPILRKALNMAIDRNAIIKTIFAGIGQPLTSLIYGSHQIGYKPLNGTYKYDQAGAKALLKQSSYDGGTITMLLAPQAGSPPELIPMAAAVADMWRAIGVNVTNRAVDAGTKVTLWSNRQLINTAAPLTLANIPGKQSTINAVFQSNGVFSVVQDPKLDALVQGVLHSANVDGWGGNMRGAAQYIFDNNYSAPIITVPLLFAGKTKVISAWKPASVQPVDDDLTGLISTKSF